MQALSELIEQAGADIAAAEDLVALDAVRVAFLGKKGALTARMKALGQLPAEERPAAGQEINRAKQALHDQLEARRTALQDAALSLKLAEDAVDVTLPGRGLSRGSRHPVSRAMSTSAPSSAHWRQRIRLEARWLSARVPYRAPANVLWSPFMSTG